MMTHTLTTEIRSMDRKLYGVPGDRVKILTKIHHPIMLVENEKGETFPVSYKFLEEITLSSNKDDERR